MATRLKEADAVMVGMGWTGAILARELTKAGLNVVGLERGADRKPAEEFTLTRLRDELRYVVRLELMQDNSIDTITFRNMPDELALPIRRTTGSTNCAASRDRPAICADGSCRAAIRSRARAATIIPTNRSRLALRPRCSPRPLKASATILSPCRSRHRVRRI